MSEEMKAIVERAQNRIKAVYNMITPGTDVKLASCIVAIAELSTVVEHLLGDVTDTPYLESFSYKGETIVFCERFHVVPVKTGGGFTFSREDLNLEVFGRNLLELDANLMSALSHLWESLVLEKNEVLSVKELMVKSRLLNMVKT